MLVLEHVQITAHTPVMQHVRMIVIGRVKIRAIQHAKIPAKTLAITLVQVFVNIIIVS